MTSCATSLKRKFFELRDLNHHDPQKRMKLRGYQEGTPSDQTRCVLGKKRNPTTDKIPSQKLIGMADLMHEHVAQMRSTFVKMTIGDKMIIDEKNAMIIVAVIPEQCTLSDPLHLLVAVSGTVSADNQVPVFFREEMSNKQFLCFP
jgi:hypothetical protein